MEYKITLIDKSELMPAFYVISRNGKYMRGLQSLKIAQKWVERYQARDSVTPATL